MNQLDLLLTPVIILLIYFIFPKSQKSIRSIAFLPVNLTVGLVKVIVILMISSIISIIIFSIVIQKFHVFG